MTNKQKRIQKVIVHREKELDQRVVELGKARAETVRVESAVESERQKLEKAAAEREAMSERSMSAREWREANEWLASRALSHHAVTRELDKANEKLEQSQAEVLTARRALKGVELVEERLKTEERKAEERADQKLSDAFAQNAVMRGKAKS
ncbi:MAG TPA: flagellar export protein FliJ [Polyangiaceae bacterium]|nr:flagellar export protein FliJ [Polyangiaceae bacterium]